MQDVQMAGCESLKKSRGKATVKVAFELHIMKILIFKAEAVYALNFNVPLYSLFLAGTLTAFPKGL